jgi:uncharacterized protein (DUF1697 family)
MSARGAGVASSVVLLRGINVGSSNRIAMPALREALTAAGLENPRTYVQSGNIVLDTGLDESELSDRVERLISERFGLMIPAVARSGHELARVAAENPFPELAQQEPKRFQVTFLRGEPEAAAQDRLRALATPNERVALGAREIYAWHPDGIARSKLAMKLGTRGGLGTEVVTTSRNWATVLTLLEMAASDAG